MTEKLPAHASRRVADFLTRRSASMARLVFALDATASRQPTWDQACHLQAEMFAEAGKIGGLEVQLAYFRGEEFRASRWSVDARDLANRMRGIMCVSGHTQIRKVLEHARKENAIQKVAALVFIGDAMEEDPLALYGAARELGVRCFMFQEGDLPEVTETFKEIARITNGVHIKFGAGSARELAELLQAVAAFAAGGLTALGNQKSDAARKLLTQMKTGTSK